MYEKFFVGIRILILRMERIIMYMDKGIIMVEILFQNHLVPYISIDNRDKK